MTFRTPIRAIIWGMETTEKTVGGLDRINIERFFQSLAGKLETKSMEIVAAAMAESVVGRDSSRVINCSPVDAARLAQVRALLREKVAGI